MDRLTVVVPKPCHQDWFSMTPVEKGRFCLSCNKKVHDFTNATSNDFIAILDKTNDGELCGSFNYDDDGRIFFRRKFLKVPAHKIFLCALMLCFNSSLFASEPFTKTLDAIRNEFLEERENTTTIYVKVIKQKKALRNAEVKITFAGRTVIAFTNGNGRLVFEIPTSTFIEEITFDVEGGGVRVYEAYCKASDLAKRDIRLKFNRPKNFRGRTGFVGCPSF